jgi:hypothetical protein
MLDVCIFAVIKERTISQIFITAEPIVIFLIANVTDLK